MSRTETSQANKISQDSIAGFLEGGAGRSAITTIQQVITQASEPNSAVLSRDLKHFWHFIPKWIRNVRMWVINEQQTAMYGGDAIETDSAIATLVYNAATWINFIKVYLPVGGGALYAVANSHFAIFSASHSIYRAPQAGDYFFHLMFHATTADTAQVDYVQLLVSCRDTSGSAWGTPNIIGGAANMAVDVQSVIIVNGAIMLRLQRGSEVRFGVKQIGSSATHGNISLANATVIISKQKFYPIIT